MACGRIASKILRSIQMPLQRSATDRFHGVDTKRDQLFFTLLLATFRVDVVVTPLCPFL